MARKIQRKNSKKKNGYPKFKVKNLMGKMERKIHWKKIEPKFERKKVSKILNKIHEKFIEKLKGKKSYEKFKKK